MLRRTDPAKSVGQKFSFGGLEVDMLSLKLSRDGNESAISKRQAKMIQYFAANAGRVVSREELYQKVWGESMGEIETRTVDMHIVKLRSIVEQNPAEPEIIKTVRGAGYVYEGPEV